MSGNKKNRDKLHGFADRAPLNYSQEAEATRHSRAGSDS